MQFLPPTTGVQPPAWPAQKSESGKLIATYDWASTSLGKIASWPAHLKTLVNLMLDSDSPMALFWGQDFRLLYNDPYATVIEDKHPGAIGSPGEATFPEFWPDLVSLFERALAGESVGTEDHGLAVARRGGMQIGYFSFSFTPIRDESGMVGGFLAIVVDTTSRAVMELERAQVFETTLSTITDFAYSFDRDGRFLFVNKALLNLWGIGLEDALGKNFYELNYPPELADRLQRQIQQVFITEKPLVDETRYVSPNGIEGYYEYIFNPVIKAKGKVDLVVGSTRDVSKRKCLEETLRLTIEELKSAKDKLQAQAETLESEVRERTAKLQESISELETFSYSISHDLRAPLRAMQSYAQIIDEESGGQMTAENRGNLRRIISATDQMDRLIQDVLIYSRVSGEELTLERIDLANLLKDLLDTHPHFNRPFADFRILSPLTFVIGNQTALVQCFSNLFANAVKFIAAGVVPKIEVWCETTERVATIFVRDNGIGIDPAFHAKIFEMFQQLDTNREGTGMGLTVARRAAQRMGGDIGLTTTSEMGSTFFVTLPLSPL